MSTVDYTKTATDAHGIVQGNGGSVDKVAGGAGNDRLQGHADFNQYYGGEGNDTFIISAKFGHKTGAATSAFEDQAAYITDFGGAGGWSASNNDFIAFSGFGAASTLSLTGTGTSGTAGAVLYFYAITDSLTGDVTNITINSLSGKALGAGDYAFYSAPTPV